ncbi:MAG TPA: MerR family transcriptional regulator [Geobacteraceae bacterium]|nr:MerR family transcriptional regulator [Geobacteraceae bacterium]
MEAGIPEKLFYRIGEVARLTSLRPSILRYWETEFSYLQPQKSRSGQRLYTRNELDLVLEIKRLLYSEKLTIEGARRVMAKRGKERIPPGFAEQSTADILQVIKEVKDDLKKIRDSL